jgi:PncC family amidohydrolase
VTGDSLSERVGKRLEALGLRLALAESCTGGMLSARLTDRPGASRFLQAALVTYSDSMKVRLLGVRQETLAEHGAVSEAVAREMLAGALRQADADAAVAITGVAGPGGGTPGKPVGTVWIAVAVRSHSAVRSYRYPGDRAAVRSASVRSAMEMLDGLMDQLEPPPRPGPERGGG